MSEFSDCGFSFVIRNGGNSYNFAEICVRSRCVPCYDYVIGNKVFEYVSRLFFQVFFLID